MLHLPRVSVILGLAIAAGCAGVSPRPEAATAATLPQVELSAAQSKRLSELVDTCVQTVVMRRYDEAERAAHSAIAMSLGAHAPAPRCWGMVMLQRARLLRGPHARERRGSRDPGLAEQLAPEDPFVGWMRAVFLAESGHVSAAAAAADEALARTTKATPEARAALLGVAGTYRYELGEERAARPLLQEYLSIRPEDAAANFRLGGWCLRIAAVPMGPKEKATSSRRTVRMTRRGRLRAVSSWRLGTKMRRWRWGTASLAPPNLRRRVGIPPRAISGSKRRTDSSSRSPPCSDEREG